MSVRVGALALQGDFDAHLRVMAELGAETSAIRKPEQLRQIDALVIPGGESTTLIKLMDAYDFWEPLREFTTGGRVFGTCAGLILVASEVINPAQRSLGLLDVTVERNSYGRQRESFESAGQFIDRNSDEAKTREIPMVFIRAPRIQRLGEGVRALATHGEDTVMARSDHVLVATFHPELSHDPFVHQYFLSMVDEPL
ncbi:MAG TPA: pyridoxal 5'-phosphate synthase glutaminase subunit PdxT [Candidatus Latescibacteria bacterium]|jgi:5'-phosphate synthase pdxT subunit|nr:pyridoxal 5'-phosphate synthase glutaminase subunit PdxT [Gemmatimonadota bacterium]MDP7365469.1 pyridoxal 5'-phosphate synthase glutaminase subunit PdxT [Candidatus Latescibacterota bacterium]MDP7632854.1 pyridoxal 5'-phosphate synthase glutaminase subunit PdxT [Candidatus Latescibacterota bacterium]HJN28890.1 pyridoxal 5'-phosphate synthase glutaminase subunit PdxT [Candidatus Latescibacterota bacterium]|tara:strand:+ start:4126 stop:4719 length:594 start_codon:yes stop_codon:yes gene_type:complete